MPTISLTSFVDFVCKSGTPKLTVVRTTKEQVAEGYDPATDFYKPLRERIVRMHESGEPKSVLDDLLAGLTDQKKVTAYPTVVEGYKKYLGKKAIVWFDPPRAEWTHNGLAINVNPELGLIVNNESYVIKMYLKREKLSKLRVDVITHLMEISLPSNGRPITFGVLDVRNAKLFPSSGVTAGVTALLQGEAASFAEIYAAI